MRWTRPSHASHEGSSREAQAEAVPLPVVHDLRGGEEVTRHLKPGVNGYRRRGCRCPDCTVAYQEYKRRQNQREQGRWGARPEPQLPPVDWSELAHLVPGATVKRRTP